MKISGLLETLQHILEKYGLFLHHMSLNIFSKSFCLRPSRFICRTANFLMVNPKISLVLVAVTPRGP